jgi:hypothetical protein
VTGLARAVGQGTSQDAGTHVRWRRRGKTKPLCTRAQPTSAARGARRWGHLVPSAERRRHPSKGAPAPRASRELCAEENGSHGPCLPRLRGPRVAFPPLPTPLPLPHPGHHDSQQTCTLLTSRATPGSAMSDVLVHATRTRAARRHAACSPGGLSPDKESVRSNPSARVCRRLLWPAWRSRRRASVCTRVDGGGYRRKEGGEARPCVAPTPDPTSRDVAIIPGTDVGSLYAPLPQARSGAMSSSVRPAVSGKHRATSSAPSNARTVKAPMATQWDATTL